MMKELKYFRTASIQAINKIESLTGSIFSEIDPDLEKNILDTYWNSASNLNFCLNQLNKLIDTLEKK